MWTDITRQQHARTECELPTDMTDREWEIIKAVMPRRGKRGRSQKWSYREILDALLYLLRGGLPWRMLACG